jgi:hypothetical protein
MIPHKKIKIIKIFIVLFIIIVSSIIITLFLGVLLERLYFTKLAMDIKKNHPNVNSVKIKNYDPLYTDEVSFLIIFDDGGTLLLEDIRKKQDNIIIRGCNGYQFYIYSRIHDNFRARDNYPSTSYGPEAYEKILNVSLESLNDFVAAYHVISNYMDNLCDITSDEFIDVDLNSGWVWQENRKKNIITADGIDYVVFKKPLEPFYY